MPTGIAVTGIATIATAVVTTGTAMIATITTAIGTKPRYLASSNGAAVFKNARISAGSGSAS